MPVIGLNHSFERSSTMMTHFKGNDFSVDILNKNDLSRNLNQMDGIVLYTLEAHEAIFEWIVELRKRSSLPIWICVPTKKVKVQSLLYLHLGVEGVFEAADLDELMIVMKQMLSRKESLSPSNAESRVTLIPDKLSVKIDRNAVMLTRLEYCLFSELLENSGDVSTYEQLKETLWGESKQAATNTQLANLICNLRNKLHQYQDKLSISTIRTKGYSLKL